MWIRVDLSRDDSFWTILRNRRIEWADIRELAELFESAGIRTACGKFFDQRFINYLFANPEALANMHWRKFEALAAEFFHREGFKVELGPGTNDGGVDIRVWNGAAGEHGSPTMLIQCKREREKVGKIVVKALYADVVAERAERGMVVTASTFSPGARAICSARSYPIEEANRGTIVTWLAEMRIPGNGVIMGT